MEVEYKLLAVMWASIAACIITVAVCVCIYEIRKLEIQSRQPSVEVAK